MNRIEVIITRNKDDFANARWSKYDDGQIRLQSEIDLSGCLVPTLIGKSVMPDDLRIAEITGQLIPQRLAYRQLHNGVM